MGHRIYLTNTSRGRLSARFIFICSVAILCLPSFEVICSDLQTKGHNNLPSQHKQHAKEINFAWQGKFIGQFHVVTSKKVRSLCDISRGFLVLTCFCFVFLYSVIFLTLFMSFTLVKEGLVPIAIPPFSNPTNRSALSQYATLYFVAPEERLSPPNKAKIKGCVFALSYVCVCCLTNTIGKYPASVSLMKLILSGDVEVNPGPKLQRRRSLPQDHMDYKGIDGLTQDVVTDSSSEHTPNPALKQDPKRIKPQRRHSLSNDYSVDTDLLNSAMKLEKSIRNALEKSKEHRIVVSKYHEIFEKICGFSEKVVQDAISIVKDLDDCSLKIAQACTVYEGDNSKLQKELETQRRRFHTEIMVNFRKQREHIPRELVPKQVLKMLKEYLSLRASTDHSPNFTQDFPLFYRNFLLLANEYLEIKSFQLKTVERKENYRKAIKKTSG